MKLMSNQEGGEANTSQVIEFAFEHDTEYQKFQFMFLDAIDRIDPNFTVVGKLIYFSLSLSFFYLSLSYINPKNRE